MERKFTYKDEKSNKFWNVSIEEKSFTVHFGKAGTKGQTQTKSFEDAAACQKEADKLIAEKLKKGYFEQKENNTAENLAVPVLGEESFLSLTSEISPEEVNKAYFANAADGDEDDEDDEDDDDEYDDEEDEVIWRIFRGDLHVASVNNLKLNSSNCLIVDGNLTVDGDICWCDDYGQSVLLITGNVKCRNLFISGCPTVEIRGGLIAESGVLGEYGDDGGVLDVAGQTKAKYIVSDTYFQMYFATRPEAVIITDLGEINWDEDFDEDSITESLLPQLLDENNLDTAAITAALKAGQSLLRPTAVPASVKLEADLNSLLEKAEEITTLTLHKCKLETIPPQVFMLPNLRELDLTNNSIKELPAEIGSLTSLEKLTLSYNSLKSLPPEITKLKKLKSLNINNCWFTEIPEILGELTSLEELFIEDFTWLPESLEKLTNLKTLFLSRCRADDFSTEQLGKLKSLTKLKLELLPVRHYSDELCKLTELTSLEIRFDDVPLVYFPDLSPLTKLNTLVLDAYTLPEIEMNKLPIWNLSSLRELTLKSFGSKSGGNGRAGCLALPDAFDGLPNLEQLFLQPSEKFSELPESFFRLKNLKKVSLGSAALTRQTMDRIREVFPKNVIFQISGTSDSCTSADPNWEKVNSLTKEGGSLLNSDYSNALKTFIKALKLCKPGKKYSDFDKLYCLYGCVYSLANMIPCAEEDKKEELIEENIKYSKLALEMADLPGEIWIFTKEGLFQLEVNRYAGNELGWWLMKQGKLDEALTAIERAEECIKDYSQYYILDTKVRILLKMGRVHDAFLIADRVLAKNPDFSDFQDIKSSEEFRQWQAEHSYTD